MTHRENLIRAIQRDHPAWVPYRYDGSLTMPTPCVVAVARAGGLDDWGVNWVGTDTPEGSYPDGQPVLTIAGMEDLKLPDTDWEALTLDLQTQVAEKHKADTLVIAKSELILFERARLLLGLEAFSLALLWAPAKLHWLFDRLADYQVQLAHAVMR